MRQSAEWGMGSFQSSFPRILDKLKYEERNERRVILILLILLFNYRANRVGINQIRNTYLNALREDGNILER